MPQIRQRSSIHALQNSAITWSKRFSRFKRYNHLQFRILGLTIILYLIFGGRKTHPTAIAMQPNQLIIPRRDENVLSFAHEYAKKHDLPVYVLYKARSGQLNNQLISFFSALIIAKQANATLVAPFAFYGSESYIDFSIGRGFMFHLRQAFDTYVYQAFLKLLGLQYKHDELVGDYIDGALLNRSQPIVSILDFRRSRGGKYLSTLPQVLTRKGDAPFFYMTLGKRSLLETNVNIRGETVDENLDTSQSPASRKELDCNFNVSVYFRGLQFNAGVNGNYLFLSKLYRSHSLNCTSANPYWLKLRRFVQPRIEIRQLVAARMTRWKKVMAVHLRFFPFDQDKFLPSIFCNFFLSRFQHQIKKVDRVYIAYSISSKESTVILSQLQQRLGSERIITAHDYGNLYTKGPAFNKRYTAPLVDMWTCVNSHYFIGRLGSSLSWNVVYWRQSLRKEGSDKFHDFYQLIDFSTTGEKNPTDSYGF